ncbi:chromosome partition protein Smc [Sphaerisporangium krabiense]|uniref:Chromosome partition protein Smc n=1 Tax=Sphaerisporangium krabiense TaxID=763782 RepID=A0A7W8Z5R1_9ACTN|nr:chromosome segregation protein SMC [Sphaerisporangium krabiense]MBB5627857.1 chromosome segregation protein [Sphaerisporangium krabiense]GII62016.1 chromosome partition protein Smc [Sphaerisporangium krabiense]
MYLKNLTLRGFKSFASATALRFEPGITCVVGPNGSGKSNVVDALAWVMGEHSAKSLRGGKMEDVIFAGTSSRPPLGRAEVTLTIDNTDGALPIDYTEVTISRLMFRSGQSEYAINGDTCRLLDIQELLSDSGIGREMHVIVGQGQLDTVLHAGPEERRAFIEEAAGVLKHRKRKEKALRKLDAMQANLTRVQDLVNELRRQLKPLGRQAEIARRAAVIQADLRDARLRLLADDVVRLRTRLEREAADEAAVRVRRAEVEGQLEAGQAREAELEAAEAAAQPRLASAQETYYRLAALKERFHSVGTLASERQRHALEAASIERRGRDPEDYEREAAEVRAREENLKIELDQAEEVLEQAVWRRTEAEEALADEERRLAAAARAAADRRESLARLRGEVAAVRGRARAAEEEIGRLGKALAEAGQRAERAREDHDAERLAGPAAEPELAEELAVAQEGLSEAEAAVEAARTAVEEARAAVEGPRRALAEARTAVGAARAADQEAQRAVAALEARRDALEMGLAEGADGGAALLAAGLPGVLGPMATLMSVRPGAEVAVAAVLGAAAEAVAVESHATVVEALELLRAKGAGKAGLVVASDAVVPRPAPADGLVWAADLVTVPEAFREAAEGLLSGVVVVDDPQAATRVVRERPELRAVTWAGDLVGAHYAYGGSGGGTSVLQMRTALDQAVADLAEVTETAARTVVALEEAIEAERVAQQAVESAQAGVSQAQTGADAAQAGVKAARRALDAVRGRQREADQRLAVAARRLAQLDAAADAARQECDRLAANVAAAEEARDRDLAGVVELEERLAGAEYADELAAEPTTETRDELAATCAVARQAEMEARLAVRTAEERVTGIAGRADHLVRAARREREERAGAAALRERRRAQAALAEAVARGAGRALGLLEASLAAAAGERDEAERARGEIDAELKAVRVRVRELSGELDGLVNRVHGTEVARTEQRLRLEQMEARAMEEFGVEVDALTSEYGPGQPVPVADGEPVPYVREEQEKRARVAEKQMAQLGKVNPLALEEFAALEERHTFLNSQLEDLRKTRRDLLLVVKEVDERVEQVFTAAYEDVAREFETIFTRVFPGGEGRLLLTDPSDMLTTGVDVEARPPGKKVKRLSLLSGGERSLTAVAFLISIFKARPSPFYVMDEVEAALDDTNTQRLLTLFEELRQSSQLIVITHQKRTMEIADALYGVSMRGDGVTQVVSQRLRERESA